MVQDHEIKARDIVLVMDTDGCGYESWPLGHAIALRDFHELGVWDDFSNRYTGPSYEFSYHFLNYLRKHKYLMMCAPGSFKTIYL